MHPNVRQGARRVHSAQFKAQVLAQCAQAGASVAAVALANGLNANLVRKWLMGRGLKRAGLSASGAKLASAVSMAARDGAAAELPVMRFVPVQVSGASSGASSGDDAGGAARVQCGSQTPRIEVELRRGEASMAVRWPASQAAGCAAWLREVAGALFNG